MVNLDRNIGDGVYCGSIIDAGVVSIYFHVDNGRYVITHGFTKKTEKTPTTELKHAKELREEWFTNDD